MSDTLDLDTIRASLRARPEIVTGDKELMESIRTALASESVVDLAARARRRLERDLARAKAANEAIIQISKANLAAQSQTHAAVLAVMEAETLPALDRTLAGRVAGALGVDAVRVFLESWAPLKTSIAIKGCSPELVEALLASNSERLGPVDPRFGDALYGPQGPGLKSEALARMEIAGRPALLCLASRDERAFAPDNGADLLHFLARAIERRIAPWLKT